MRKLASKLVVLAMLGVLSTAGVSAAAMIGGLAAPLNESEASLSLVLAYAQRDVKDGAKDEASTRRFLFRGAYGLGKGFDIYAFAGLSDISYKTAKFNGSLGESLGAGVRYSPAEFSDGSRFVLDGQAELISSDDGTDRVDYTMYRAAAFMVGKFGSSGKFGFLYPYGGVSVSKASYQASHTDDFKGEGNIGLIAGTDFFINPNVFFTLEFHLFDESAVYLSSGYRF